MNILIRCDGSVKLGMGHIVRCLALAEELRNNHNCIIHFATRESEQVINTLRRHYTVFASNENDFNYVTWVNDAIEKSNAKILILDSRDEMKREWLRGIKQKTGVKVVTIDDPEEKRLEADLVLYPPVPQVEKLPWGEFNGCLLVGWEYVILRQEFNRHYKKPTNKTPIILVSMGGSDPKGMTKYVVEHLNFIEYDFILHIILGSEYKDVVLLNSTLAQSKYKYVIYINPQNVAEIMSQVDFGIISFGVTAYELAALNIPSLMFSLTPDHEESATILASEGIGFSLGLFSDRDTGAFLNAVSKYLEETSGTHVKPKFNKTLCISNLPLISKHILEAKAG